MITLSVESQSCRVGLLAVNKFARRDGIGKRLLVRAQGWCFAQGVFEAIVVTQDRNNAAVRFYRHCGYQIKQENHVYHFWPV
ncbi:MAG: GNAT family N-acetyltransferase [Pirellulaceae bacterium]|nr:GNAT family N-acetyltransferase [Pirellulaceae bacterium]